MRRDRQGRLASLVLAAISVGFLATSACTGSGAEDGCPDLASCGGDPTGNWKILSDCRYVPPLSYNIMTPYAPQQMLSQVPPQSLPVTKSSGDWCSSLVYGPVPGMPAMITTIPTPAHSPGPLTDGTTLILSPDHTYSVAIQSVGVTTGHFAPSCLQAFGAKPSCSDLAAQLNVFVTMPNFAQRNPPFSCTQASDLGCDCSWAYESTAADQGFWQTSGDVIYFFDNQGTDQPIVEATFCAKPGQQLSLSGRNGTSMFSVQGLRTITFTPM